MLQKVGHAKLNKFCLSMKAQQRKFDLETSKSAILPWEVSMKKSTYTFLPLLGLALLAVVSGVQAATIQVGSGKGAIYLQYEGAVVYGYTGSGPYTLSSSNADFYDLSDSSPSSEAAQLNTLIGSSVFNANNINKLEDGGSVNLSSFEIHTEYFAIKQGSESSGGGTAFFKITPTSSLPVTFQVFQTLNVDGSLSDPLRVSHVSQFVPIPAAAYLFGSALLGMAGIGYSRNKKRV